MRVSSAALALLIALGPALVAPTVRAADNDGEVGRILSLTRNSPNSDAYALAHGNLVLKPKTGDEQIYYWGGSRCPGATLTDAEVGALQGAFLARKPWLRPVYKLGQGGSLCLIAFTVSHKP